MVPLLLVFMWRFSCGLRAATFAKVRFWGGFVSAVGVVWGCPVLVLSCGVASLPRSLVISSSVLFMSLPFGLFVSAHLFKPSGGGYGW